jgi:hypothetical protein
VNLASDFEKELVETMILENCTMQEALVNLFSLYKVNTKSVIDLVDFLENMIYDLNKVQFLMQIYTGQIPDMQLVDFKDEKKKDRNKG